MYTEEQLKWQKVDSILCDLDCDASCPYLEVTYESSVGDLRRCRLLETDWGAPEDCPRYEEKADE